MQTTFNAPTALDTDGAISYVVTSGTDNGYANNTLFTGGSGAFNAVMNAGGTYEFGGAGAGTVTISNLTPSHVYSVQVFNYAGDGDTGLTTFAGVVPVTVSTEVGGVVTQGQFATGTHRHPAPPRRSIGRVLVRLTLSSAPSRCRTSRAWLRRMRSAWSAASFPVTWQDQPLAGPYRLAAADAGQSAGCRTGCQLDDGVRFNRREFRQHSHCTQ